jgi:predicted DNA-binding transcriptional regulator AlpA
VTSLRFLTWQQLHDLGILPSRQHTRRLIEQGMLPKPYRLGDPDRGNLAWRESDIEDWLQRRAAERDAPRRRNSGGNVVPPRPRYTAGVGPKIILSRPVR